MRKLLYKIYLKTILPISQKFNTLQSSKIPFFELSEKHVKNAKLLAKREDILQKMPQNAVVAELGVDKGDFSEQIMQITQPKKFHIIDFWGSKRYSQDKRRLVEKSLKMN